MNTAKWPAPSIATKALAGARTPSTNAFARDAGVVKSSAPWKTTIGTSKAAPRSAEARRLRHQALGAEERREELGPRPGHPQAEDRAEGVADDRDALLLPGCRGAGRGS
jgi:hypothetical protein